MRLKRLCRSHSGIEIEYNKQPLPTARVLCFFIGKGIYENDSERKQTPEVAERTFEYMYETYKEYGYQVIEVPKTSVQQRIRFILDRIEKIP